MNRWFAAIILAGACVAGATTVAATRAARPHHFADGIRVANADVDDAALNSITSGRRHRRPVSNRNFLWNACGRNA